MNDTLPPLDSDLIYRAFHEANRKREHWQGELCSTSFYAGARWAYAIATRPAVLDEWTRNVLAESLRAIERPECAGLAMNTDGLKENLRRLASAPTPPTPPAPEAKSCLITGTWQTRRLRAAMVALRPNG